MASQIHIGSLQSGICAETTAETQEQPVAVRKIERCTSAEQIVAHSFEFVALPGRAVGIQAEIPIAMKHAFSATQGFVGCLVLVSEQETRLVTVITLWSGTNRFELSSDAGRRLQKWLAPYVDRWLRTRQYASFLTAPHRFLTASVFPDDVVVKTSHLQ